MTFVGFNIVKDFFGQLKPQCQMSTGQIMSSV